jgi:L-lysine exporter family protein LysE/ArgO
MTSNLSYLIEGLLLGFAYAIPIGAQNIFVIHSAAAYGFPKSFKTALIVSLMDVSLGLACFFGVGALIDKWAFLKLGILAGGAFFLFYYGFKLLVRTSNVELGDVQPPFTALSIAKTTFILTWFNPQAIIDGSVLFGSYRATLPTYGFWPFLIGIAIASPIWFFSITALVGSVKRILSDGFFLILNRTCGFVLILFAIKFLDLFVRTAV